MTEARELTPPIHPFLSFTPFLLSFPHHHHLASIGIVLFLFHRSIDFSLIVQPPYSSRIYFIFISSN
jgi:hypothetical protein